MGRLSRLGARWTPVARKLGAPVLASFLCAVLVVVKPVAALSDKYVTLGQPLAKRSADSRLSSTAGMPFSFSRSKCSSSSRCVRAATRPTGLPFVQL
jgi:hypothetical protein